MSVMKLNYNLPAKSSCPKRLKTIAHQRKDGTHHLSKYFSNVRNDFKLERRLSLHVREDFQPQKGRLSHHFRN